MDFDTVEDAWDFWTEFGARTANEIELADVSGILVKRPHNVLSKRAGGVEGNGYIGLDHKNFLWTKRQCELRYGDVGNILSYFAQKTKENPFFFYDHTILYNETVTSFEWQFQSFLNCHSQKHPKILFTDQDPALAEAIRIVMKVTYHGLCTSHIMLNDFRHLENLMKDGTLFLTHFQECMYAYISEEAFEHAREEKWASCYIKNVHTLGMRSIQLSESCNAELKRHLKSSFSLVRFFRTFEEVVYSKNYTNLKLKYESKEKLFIHASAYVVTRYDDRVGEYALKSFSESNEAIMSFNRESEDILSNCKKIEEWGFLCGHAIRILDLSFIF
uniref:MULE transposase domain-containing protein n=1 Tax=Kalanchoe fedtschenkoi TaxID=63787 RepID=A0A7N0VN12_KALFE